MPKSKNKRKSRSGKNRTPLSGHSHVKKKLIPPFAQLEGMIEGKFSFSSWTNERMPEMLWAVIIRSLNGQEFALSQFRRIINFIGKHERREELSDITHTGIAKLDRSLRVKLIRVITNDAAVSESLAILRLFGDLPAVEDWMANIPESPPNIELLMDAVGKNLWHQSQEATDCRWIKLMAQVASGKFRMPREMIENLVGYPDVGDQHSVRPSIRSAEIAPTTMEPPDTTWANSFWQTAWFNTPCLVLNEGLAATQPPALVSRAVISDAQSDLEEHWQETHSTTAIDARHDAVFGIAFYALRITDELLGIGIGTGVLGRLGLRTLLEAYVSIHYLLRKDDESIWKKWRAYGSGQAKLNVLRFDTDIAPPKYIDIHWLEQIAGEDIWEEFLSIDLGSWSGLDLRKLSEKAGCKDLYDAYYSWTSGYVHGSWGSVRESSFNTCGNPLHRMHRYPEQHSLPDTVSDAIVLTNKILDDVAVAYPSFTTRVLPAR